jgi:hypothetical protein
LFHCDVDLDYRLVRIDCRRRCKPVVTFEQKVQKANLTPVQMNQDSEHYGSLYRIHPESPSNFACLGQPGGLDHRSGYLTPPGPLSFWRGGRRNLKTY